MAPEAPRGAIVDLTAGTALDRDSLESRVAVLGSVLARHGVRPGSVVAVLPSTTTASVELLLTVRRTGAALLLLDPALSLEELAYAVNVSGSSALFSSPEHMVRAEALQALTPAVHTRFVLADDLAPHLVSPDPGPTLPLRGTSGGTLHCATSLGRPTTYRAPDPVREAAGRRDVAIALGAYHVDADTVLVCATSLTDPVAAQLVVAVSDAGGSVVLPAAVKGLELLQLLREHKATVVHLGPRAAVDLARLDEETVRRLLPPRLALSIISAPGPPARVLEAVARRFDGVFRQVYVAPGIGVLAGICGEELLVRPGSVGRPAEASVRVLPGPGDLAGAIEAERPDAPGEWSHWGEYGRIDSSGYLYVVDREAWALDSGVSLLDIERALAADRRIADVAVTITTVGGHRRLVAYLEPEGGLCDDLPSHDDLLAVLPYVPARWRPRLEYVSSLPRTATGKLDRRRLRRADPFAVGALG